MTPKFLTNQEAQKRIAELEAIVAKGATNSASVREIDTDEALVAHMKADRLKREAAKGATDPSKAAAAVKARLDAGRAALAAAEARATAKKAAAAVAPGLTTAAEFAGKPLRMSREEFRKLSAPDRARFIREGGKITD